MSHGFVECLTELVECMDEPNKCQAELVEAISQAIAPWIPRIRSIKTVKSFLVGAFP